MYFIEGSYYLASAVAHTYRQIDGVSEILGKTAW